MSKWTLQTDTGDDTVPDREYGTEDDGSQTGYLTGTESPAQWWYVLSPPEHDRYV